MRLLNYALLLGVFTGGVGGRNLAKVEEDSKGVLKELGELRREMVELRELKKSYLMLSSNISDLSDTLYRFHNRESDPNDVYFTASLSHDTTGIAYGETVIYGNAFSTNGVGYDKNTGVFTAPTSGVYLFQFFCNSLKSQASILVMMWNGIVRGDCMVEPSYDGEDETGGDVFIGWLSVGDRVWVEAYDSDHDTVDLKKTLNTFAGVLIHR